MIHVTRPGKGNPSWQAESARFFSTYINRCFSRKALEKIEKSAETRPIGMILLQIDAFFDLVGAVGEDAGFCLMETLKREGEEQLARLCPGTAILTFQPVRPDELLICFAVSDQEVGGLAEKTLLLRQSLNQALQRASGFSAKHPFSVRAGMGLAGKGGSDGFYRRLFKAFCDAQRMASATEDMARITAHQQFLLRLDTAPYTTLFQPVMDFKDGTIHGWESLLTLADTGISDSPATLMEKAEEMGEIVRLESDYRNQTFSRIGRMEPGQRLFLNAHASATGDPACDAATLAEQVRANGLGPENVILEFAEARGGHLSDILIARIEPFQDVGFPILFEEVGDGDIRMQTISQIKPDFIKLAPGLVHDIDCNPIKRALTESLTTLARRMGSAIIADGIRSDTEMSCLISMNIRFGQGPYIAAPGWPKPGLSIRLPEHLTAPRLKNRIMNCSASVRNLVNEAVAVSPETLVRDIRKTAGELPPMSSVVIAAERKPVGLLMNYRLDRKLGSPYGISLYYKREIWRIMDPNPLTVDIEDGVESVAKAAMTRDETRIYDDIVVTENGLLAGTISVQKLLDYLAELQVKIAMGANPLSGLPGNVAIENEIERRTKEMIPSSFIYVDLDNFKVYNDSYGFDRGDKLLRFTADTIKEAIRTSGRPDDFVGHVGGDDFVVISDQARATAICEAITERFGENARTFYSPKDRESGFIVGKGRDGVERSYPLVSVSVAIVDCDFRALFSMDELSQRVAEVKKYAKSLSGNTFVRDRRAPLGSVSTEHIPQGASPFLPREPS